MLDAARTRSRMHGGAAIAVVVLVALGLAGAALALSLTRRPPPRAVRIATGAAGGTYHPIGAALAEILTEDLPGVAARAVETAGGPDNMRRLEAGEVELALIQNDTPGGADVRTLAPLYEEVFQVVV